MDIVPLLIVITTSKNDTAVIEYSCVKLMFGSVLLAFPRKVSKLSIPCGQIRKISSIYQKYAAGCKLHEERNVFPNVMHKNIGVCWCHFFSHGYAIDLQILFVVKHIRIMFQYEIYQCRNVINQCLVTCEK